jgi:hypothetical protein
MNEYPFFEKVRARIEQINDPDKTIGWLAEKIGRTTRWFYGIDDMGKIPLAQIQDICRLLEFNFIEDYSNWQVDQGGQPYYALNEPQPIYKNTEERRVSVSLKLAAPISVMTACFGKVYQDIITAAEKAGFEVE